MGDPMADDFLSYMVYFFKALFLKTLKFQVCRHFSLRLVDEFSWDTKQIVHNLCSYGHVKPKFRYFLNQHSNVYLEKDERQALRTRKHNMLNFLDNSIGIFMRYPCLKSGQLQRPTYRQYGFYLIK